MSSDSLLLSTGYTVLALFMLGVAFVVGATGAGFASATGVIAAGTGLA